MTIKKVLLGVFFFPQVLFSQIEVSKSTAQDKDVFPIVTTHGATAIYTDAGDFEVVKKSAEIFASDVERVTGKKPSIVQSRDEIPQNLILVGTIGKNKLLDELIATKKLNIDSIQNQWERYCIQTVQNPFPGVQQALVIAGSDRRGTAFGIFSVSQAIGVSPWYWWADVPIQKSAALGIKQCNYISKSPRVKYRGIFINDEDWGIFQWAKNTFEPEYNNIGPKTYEKIFELMLRLRLNYIWPAMHECTKEFGSVPENYKLADQYGIVAGSSHCEPMLCNNANWDQKVRGAWNYSLNRDTIYNYWESSVKERGSFEAVWTIGIRGIHDQGMQKPPVEVPERIKLVSEVFKDQRGMLDSYVTKQWGPVAQCFVPYKEVLPLYNAGLEVPDDVTIVWVDDNFGYIRRLGVPAERKRSGGAGIYWHLSYYGGPHSYLWVNTTAPALMWEELHKAWENDVRSTWVINVGDIKPMELGIGYFAAFAFDPETVGPTSQPEFLQRFTTSHFGEKLSRPLTELLTEYYRLGTIRKPEEMNRQWMLGLPEEQTAQLKLDYGNLLKKEEKIASIITKESKDAYFEMIGFSAKVLGASGLIFVADREMQMKATDSIKAQKEIDRLRTFLEKQVSHFNNEVAGGKWKYMMPGLETAKDLTRWNSQVRWPWGEKQGNVAIPKSENTPVRHWRNAASADRQTTSSTARWTLIEGLGTTGKALALKPAGINNTWAKGDKSAPMLAFDFQTEGGNSEALIDFLPTFRICPPMQLRVAVCIDDQQPVEVEVPGSNGKEDENGPNRKNGIMNNYVRAAIPLTGLSKGKHVLKIYAVDPGVVIDKISLPK
jgi:hypothetical protein